jgi:hypothetical protein
MNKTPILLLAAFAGSILLTACDVDHNALGTPPPTTAYTPAPTTTTTPTPDLQGNYCWTERNTYLPEGVEGLCSPDFAAPNQSFFLHWGMPVKEDYQNRICKGDGREECPLAATPTKSPSK